MTASPIALQIPADLAVNLHGHTSGRVSVTVKDAGTKPLTVHAYAANLGAASHIDPAASWVKAVEPATFKLAPGQSERVTLVLAVPHGASRAGSTNLAFRAAPLGSSAQLHLSAVVASAVTISNPGMSAAPAGHPLTVVAPAHHDGMLTALLAGGGIVLALAVILAALLRPWRRHRGTRGAPRRPVAPASSNGHRASYPERTYR